MRVWRIINLRDGDLWTGTHCGKSDNVARRMGEVIVVWDSLLVSSAANKSEMF